MTPVIGLVDIPREQIQRPWAPPIGREGHLAIYSAPGYGKTTALQTLIMSLAHSHSPDDVQFYLMDFGSRLLKLYERLPHVGAVITADEPERLRRLLLLLRRTLDERRERFGRVGAPTLTAFRRDAGESLPAVVVVLDNYANLVEATREDEETLAAIAQLAQDGSSLGVYLVVTANNSATIRFQVSSNLMLAIALHLVEASEYAAVVGRNDDVEPNAIPGRGRVRGTPPLEVQIAQPALGDTDAERRQALQSTIMAMDAAWKGLRPLPVPSLPAIAPLDQVLALAPRQPLVLRAPENGAMPAPLDLAAGQPPSIGVYVDDLTRFAVDLTPGAHFLVAGTGSSGKSTLLRTWACALATVSPPMQLELHVVDSLRGDLAPLQGLSHLCHYAGNVAEADELLAKLEAALAARGQAQGPDATDPCTVLLIDDLWDTYDNPISQEGQEALARLLRAGRGRSFHMIVAGPYAELSKRSWEKPVKQLRELQLGFVMGTAEDGVLNTRQRYSERAQSLDPGVALFVQRNSVRRVKIAVGDTFLPMAHTES